MPTTVFLQDDNAPVHFNNDDEDWMRASSENPLWQFKLKDQPANSPDCNILDLGFFRALQSLQFQRKPATTIDGLIANVEAAWEDYDPVSINSVFLTHQSCMNKIIESMGGNEYKIPHVGKKALNNAGLLPSQLDISDDASSVLAEQVSGLLPQSICMY